MLCGQADDDDCWCFVGPYQLDVTCRCGDLARGRSQDGRSGFLSVLWIPTPIVLNTSPLATLLLILLSLHRVAVVRATAGYAEHQRS